MFEKITPEQAGISSKTVLDFINKLEKREVTVHGMLFMKGDKIFAEGYWSPFNKDFCHRQYSQTKSFVSIAIGLLLEEGKLSLDDKIIKFFSEKIDGETPHEYLKNQTVREMLLMTTVGAPPKWLNLEDPDRTHLYFNHERQLRLSGTIWEYDSAGSQVLSSLVEKLSGKTLLDYLKEKLFNKMGTFQTATILKTPNGDSWGDSAMICTLRDMASFGRLVLNYGVYNGERLMKEEYLKEATSNLVDNSTSSYYSAHHLGYGYQIWQVCGGGFAFVGMGDQLTVCYPEKDLIFACNCDNQGNPYCREIILINLEEMFVEKIQDQPILDDKNANLQLEEKLKDLKLRAIHGPNDSVLRQEINGKEYDCEPNTLGITKFSFVFNGNSSGEFRYTNAQGEKTIPFGVNENVFGKFPQLGYANEVGNVPTTDGFMYDDAVSFAWEKDKGLRLYIQIIDKHFGIIDAKFYFKEEKVCAYIFPVAEGFLKEYCGIIIAQKHDEKK